MSKDISQKCLILRSRTQKPLFQLQTRIITYNSSYPLVKVLCFSVDPVMKFFLAGAQTYFRKVKIGDIFNCFGLGIVIQINKNQDCGYQIGDYVFGNLGTCDLCVLDQQRQRQCFVVSKKLVKMYGQGQFLYLINNGLAAYAGYQIMQPQQNQTVVVSTASGATGILLCQLLNKKKIKVIGLTSPHKFSVIKNYVTKAINYSNKQQLTQTLQNTKFKYYFDNVGQHLLDQILKYIEKDGKIALCGAIANYSNYDQRGIKNAMNIINKRLTLTGLTFMSMISKMDSIFKQYENVNLRIIIIKIEEFQHYFTELLKSGNDIIGKVIVKL